MVLKELTKPKKDCNSFRDFGLLKDIALSIRFLDMFIPVALISCPSNGTVPTPMTNFFGVEGDVLFPTTFEHRGYVSYKCVICLAKYEHIVNIYLANVIYEAV